MRYLKAIPVAYLEQSLARYGLDIFLIEFLWWRHLKRAMAGTLRAWEG